MDLQDIRQRMRLRIKEKDNPIVFTEKTHRGEAGVIRPFTLSLETERDSGAENK